MPISGCYLITAKGAKGGDFINEEHEIFPGGRGALVEMKLCSLLAGERLTIIVGQAGTNGKGAGGGGGASFVYNEVKEPAVLYLAAGGGGGNTPFRSQYNNSGGLDGQSGQDGEKTPNNGGKNGNGGSFSPDNPNSAGAGAGWLSSGKTGSKGNPGHSRREGNLISVFCLN